METVISYFPSRWLAYGTLALAILLISSVISLIVSRLMRRFFRVNNEKLNLDPTTFLFLRNGASFAIYLLALIFLFYNIPELKSIGVALFAGAGIFAAIIGLGSQQAFSNIISGIMIVVFKPFRVNDLITVATTTGYVEDITLRHTVIRDFQNKRLVIPNAIISAETIINSHINDERTCVFLQVGISYGSDLDKAMEILREEAMKHPLQIDKRSPQEKANGAEEVKVRVIGFGDSSVDLRAWVWTANPDHSYEVLFDLNRSVKLAFDKHGIEIPFPYRTVILRNDEKSAAAIRPTPQTEA